MKLTVRRSFCEHCRVIRSRGRVTLRHTGEKPCRSRRTA